MQREVMIRLLTEIAKFVDEAMWKLQAEEEATLADVGNQLKHAHTRITMLLMEVEGMPDEAREDEVTEEITDDDPIDRLTICPVCQRQAAFLGSLGSRLHFRCRDCGVDYSHEGGDDDDFTQGTQGT